MNTPAVAEKPAMTESQKIFNEAFERTQKEIPFKKEWSNGTGFYDFAIYGEHAPTISPGVMMRSVTPGGRKLLLIGTRLGNVVIFERHDDNNKSAPPSFYYQSTTNFNIGGWFSHQVLDEYEMEIAVGVKEAPQNIGQRIDLLYSAMKKST